MKYAADENALKDVCRMDTDLRMLHAVDTQHPKQTKPNTTPKTQNTHTERKVTYCNIQNQQNQKHLCKSTKRKTHIQREGKMSDLALPSNLADWPILTGHTPATLIADWKKQCQPVGVIAFYRESRGAPWREFSNWYSKEGFTFILPQQLLDLAGVTGDEDHRGTLFAPIVYCENSEKALMLCKAAAMGDATAYAAICASTSAKECKRLGSKITNWSEKRYNSVICGMAVCFLYQKFSSSPHLTQTLLLTGNKVLAEATAGDQTWAIGLSTKMPKVYEVPARWKGSNILGWALMQVREILRQEDEKRQKDQEHGDFDWKNYYSTR